MTGKCFVDSNVWVYARDSSDPWRQAQALELLGRLMRGQEIRISVQVVSEVHEAIRRRIGTPSAVAAAEALLAFSPEPLTADTLRRALELERRRSISWWDALIVSSALMAGCERLYTEDWETGTRVDGLEIVNPFAPGASA